MIRIYSMPDCQPCQTAKKWLDERGIDYEEVNVKTREGATEFRKLNAKNKSVPFIITGHNDPDRKPIAFRYFNHELFEVLWGG